MNERYLTLDKLRQDGFNCEYLLGRLKKDETDSHKLSLIDVIELDGTRGAMLCLKHLSGYESELRHLACDIADHALGQVTYAQHHEAIRVARLYADGKATKSELSVARRWAADYDIIEHAHKATYAAAATTTHETRASMAALATYDKILGVDAIFRDWVIKHDL
ncbi:MAG: hypothetical protein JRE23_14965 [Deltaproteobacteria bacterium]|nr:hypothetical protein [Deltaproteobacteria bacterium]